MAEKARFISATRELDIQGEFDETTALTGTTKGKIVAATGDFVGLEWNENTDILEGGNNLPNKGSFGGYFNRYTQTNMSVTTKKGTGKDGNNYAYVIHRLPNIASTSTWGGVSLYPPDSLQRVNGKKFRLSFDYRGYSNGNGMECYQNYSIGWGSAGIGLPTPWSNGIGAFDTDWEWVHAEREFTISSTYNDFVPGSNQPAWSSTTQYGTGWFAVTYNGYVYRHRSGWPAPTLGVDPETEYQAGGIYDWRVPMTAGYLDLYNNIKIGFNYQTQGVRGTHVHIDNIQLTDITDNETFKFDISANQWNTDNAADGGFDILAKGTAYVGQARTDVNSDVFAVEGSRYVSINGTSANVASGRGLALVVFNSAGTVLSNTNYDVHAGGSNNTNLANALAAITSDQYWILTSFDAVGSEATHNATPALRNQLVAMKSKMWDSSQGDMYLWYHNTNDVRNPYAAVGKGQRIIKEDGSGALDTRYKRKGVIQTRIS